MCLTPKLNTYFQLVNTHAYTIKNISINLNGNMKKTARFFFLERQPENTSEVCHKPISLI